MNEDRFNRNGFDRTKFKTLKVAVIGAGATGSNVAEMITRAGLYNTLYLYDFDTFELHNGNRQKMIEEDIGMNKAQALTRYLKAVSKDATIFPITEKVSSETQLPKDIDIIFSCVDNVKSRVMLNNYIKRVNNKCVIFDGGTSESDANEGSFMTLWHSKKKADSQEYEDLYPNVQERLKTEENTPSCTDNPAPAIITTTAIIAACMTQQMINYVIDDRKTFGMGYVILKKKYCIEWFKNKNKEEKK